jgi:hypothetical protein
VKKFLWWGEVKRFLNKRYVLAGLFAAIAVLSSLVLVYADYPPEYNLGWISPKGKMPLLWVYLLPPPEPGQDPEFTAFDIQQIRFYFGVDGENIEIPTIEHQIIDDYHYEFSIPPQYMRYGGQADYSFIEVQMDDLNWYWAVGPAPMWRRRP